MLDRLQALWLENVEAASDPQLQRLIEHFSTSRGPRPDIEPPEPLGLTGKVRRLLSLLAETGLRLGGPVRSAVPRKAIYLNIGQLGLAVPPFFNWLEARSDVTCAIMLHDVIPLEYPHFVRPQAVEYHQRMVRTAVRHADCLIYNTESARASVEAAMKPYGRGKLPSLVRSLPLPAAFADVRESVPQLEHVNYFVVVSAIEPRKNHDLLLRAWQQMIRRMGKAAPHLVIVGSPGHGARRMLDLIQHDPVLRTKVHIVSGLSSKGLASLVLGAAGMLCPSLAEGFGLPVLEACALGVPTIASNIAAHREVANDKAILLPADDANAWESAIAGLVPAGKRKRPAVPASTTEAAYSADILAFLDDL
jgi:glycosyltransferase involved in cell wall biosynthesis